MTDRKALDEVRELIRRGRSREAVRRLRKSVSGTDDPEAWFLLSRAYYKIGAEENSRAFFILSEDSAVKALKSRPRETAYNDHLVSVSRRLGKLDSLSRRYRELLEKEEDPFYSDMLKKIAAIGIAAIPGPDKKRKKKSPLIRFVLNYFIMPSLVATGFFSLYSRRHRSFSAPLLLLSGAYVLYRIFSRPRSSSGKDW